MIIKTFASTALLAVVTVPTAALAQATPDITDAINQGTRIEDARRAQEATIVGPELEDSSEIDGEAGI